MSGNDAGREHPTMRITVMHPDRLNLYADRGNVLVLAQRCQRRDIAVEITSVRLGDRVADIDTDLIYIGGGQDRDQRTCAIDLTQRRTSIAEAIGRGTTVLGICGGYQLLGHEYVTADGTIEGLGLLDIVTHRLDDGRLVGNVVVDVDPSALDTTTNLRPTPTPSRTLAGFENHRGRTVLGDGCQPLGRVRVGNGNNGLDGTEGAVDGSVLGTYLHGPLLATNVWLADVLIERAVGGPLATLADRFEDAVHVGAVQAAER